MAGMQYGIAHLSEQNVNGTFYLSVVAVDAPCVFQITFTMNSNNHIKKYKKKNQNKKQKYENQKQTET